MDEILQEMKDSEIINSNSIKQASNKCISSFRALTYEMEKITDVLIRLLEEKDSKNKDLKTLEEFKKDLEELKKYSMSELNTTEFQINIKDTFSKVSKVLKDFHKIVIITAKRNGLYQITKTSRRLMPMIISVFETFNNYLISTSDEINKFTNDIQKKVDKVEKDNNKKSLHEDFGSLASGFIEGASNAVKHILSMLTLRTKSFDESTEAVSKALADLTEKANEINTSTIDKNHTALDNLASFFTTKEFGVVTGGIAAGIGIFIAVKKLWEKIKRKITA